MTIQETFIASVLARVNGSEAKAAKAAGISPRAFNHYKLGRRVADDEAIMKMADFLGEDAATAVAKHHAEHAKTERLRVLYSTWAKAAVIAVCTFSAFAQVPFSLQRIVPIMSNMVRRTMTPRRLAPL